MFRKLNIFSKLKNIYTSRVHSRKLYDEDMVSKLSSKQKIYLRSRYLRQLVFFSLLLFLSLFALVGVSLLDSSGTDLESSYQSYKSEESLLSNRLDSIYGKGNWEFGIYQTNLDAYRVLVTLSNGGTVEHYYRVENKNIYRLELK